MARFKRQAERRDSIDMNSGCGVVNASRVLMLTGNGQNSKGDPD